jgi:Crp-like helix-turn-helix domain
MLGVQRSSVSLTANGLQKAGLIQYSRRKIKILDRKGVEECACECYGVVKREMERSRREGSERSPLKRPPPTELGFTRVWLARA